MDARLVVELLAFAFTLLTSTITATWFLADRMRKNRTLYLAEILKLSEHTATEFKELEHRWNEKLEEAYKHFAEGPNAIREKVNQIELYIRDNYVEHPTYLRDQDQMSKIIHELKTSIERQFETLGKKIDVLMRRGAE